MSPSPPSSSRSSGRGREALAVDASAWQLAGRLKRRRVLPLHRLGHPPSEGLEKSMDSQNNLSLPEDIILQILLQLPAKSLVRFMCVCKSWFFLISDPHFAKSHFERSLAAPTHRVLYIPDFGSHPRSVDIDAPFHQDFTVPFPNLSSKIGLSKKSPIQFRGSCRGVLLLGNKNSFRNLILWNPSTGAYKALPYPPNASECRHVTGLGYDEATDDYLVVMTSLRRFSGADVTFYLEIFSVRKNSWEVIELQHPPLPKVDTFSKILINCGLFFNGVIHWNVDKVILCFDLKLRKFSEMITPHKNFALMVVGGCLAAHDGTKVWVMKEYKVQSWTKYCDANIELHPICVNKDGEMIAVLGLPSGGGKLVKLNDKGEQLESRDCCRDMVVFGRAVYMESLFSFSCQIRSGIDSHHDNPPQVNSLIHRQIRGAGRHSRIPIGFYFCPKDEDFLELLRRKLINPSFTRSEVVDGDVHVQDPEQIFPDDVQRCALFFSHLPLLHPNSRHVNRQTLSGEWVLVKEVAILKDDKTMGFKNIFNWQKDGFVTNWIMKEYQLSSTVILSFPKKCLNEETLKKINEVVICEVKLKEGALPNKD